MSNLNRTKEEMEKRYKNSYSENKKINTTNESDKKIIKSPNAIKFKIVSNGLIEISPSNKIISVILSKFKDSKYDFNKDVWLFPVDLYETIKKELKSKNIFFSEIPKGTLSIVKKNILNENFNLTDNVYSKLLPFQREGVNFALNRNGRIILADDMGLGKTFQALAIAYYYRIEWPLLVIAPASLLDSWHSSIFKFLNEDCTVIRNKIDIGGRINIISYDLASKNIDSLKNYGFKVLIVDECHYIKDMKSMRTTKLLPFLQESTRVILLSGTPALSRPLELYPLICAIDKKIFPNFIEYGKRYCGSRKIGKFYVHKGCTNAEELYYILNKYLMIRRTKDVVMNELPPKFRKHVILNVKNKKTEIKDEIIIENPSSENILLLKEAAELKIESVKDYILILLDKKIKFLVFVHHNCMIDGLEEFLKSKEIQFIKIDGRVSSQSRHQLCTKFQDDENVRVALLSITACSTGLNLTSAKAVVFGELYWNPGNLLQAEDRIHRIGQKSNVDIHYLTAKGTIDEKLWPILLRKMNVLESLGIGKNEFKNINTHNHVKGQKTLEDYKLNKSSEDQ